MKKTIKRLGICFLFLLILVAAYGAYVLSAYERMPDKLTLEVKRNGENSYFEDEKVYNVGEFYRIMTYNIGFGAYQQDYSFFMDGGKSSRAKDEESVVANTCNIGEMIKFVSPDFILLQEVDVDGTRSHHVNQLELINDFNKGYYYTFAQNYDSPYLFYPFLEPHGANKSGLVTMSRTAISDAMRRSLPIAETLSKFVDLDRCYSISEIPLENGKSLFLYNVHLSAYSTDEIRMKQLNMLYEDMAADYQDGNYVICGGDFNHNLRKKGSGESPDVSYFPRETLPEGFRIALDGLRYPSDVSHDTCRSAETPYKKGETPTYTLDGFIVTDNVSVNYYLNMDWDFEYSDHDPVLLEFKLKE